MDKLIEWGYIGVLKLLFEYLTSSFALFEDPMKNCVSLYFVGVLSFLIAWIAVRKLYAEDIINGKGIGSIFHWTIRLIVFVVIWFVFATIIRIINWILKIPTFIWFGVGGVVVLIGIAFVVVKIVSWRKSKI